MKEHLNFLRISSTVVKIAAWIFLILGIIGGFSIFFNFVPGYERWIGIIVFALYVFFFFLFYLIAKISDLLVKLINEIKKE